MQQPPPYQPGQSGPNYPQHPQYLPQQPYVPQPQYQQMPPVVSQPQKKPFSMGCAGIVGMMLVGAFIGVFIGYVAHGSPDSVTTPTTTTSATASKAHSQPTTAPVASAHHKIGEVVSVDGKWEVTFTQAHTVASDTLNQPQKAGNVYLLIDVTMKNISSVQASASSVIQFDLRTPDGTKITETLRTDSTPPDGNVSAGQQIKGTLSYEVAPDQHVFQMDFISDFAAQQVTWDVQV